MARFFLTTGRLMPRAGEAVRLRNLLRASRQAAVVALAGSLVLLTPSVAGVTTRHVYEGQSITAAVERAGPGERIVVHEGWYPAQLLTSVHSSPVTVEAADGEAVAVERLVFSAPANNIIVRGLTIRPRRGDGIRFEWGTANIVISGCTTLGGRVGILFDGGPRVAWPRNIRIEASNIFGSAIDNIRIDGGRDLRFERNWIHDNTAGRLHSDGIQAMASRNVTIYRNTFSFSGPAPASSNQAIILGHADPREPARTVSKTRIASNLIHHWPGTGIILAGSHDTAIVNNTIYDSGLHGRDASLVLSAKDDPSRFGNTRVVVANNILFKTMIVRGAVRPGVETHNLVRLGGAGRSLIGDPPRFASRRLYTLAADSPAVASGAGTLAPRLDLRGRRLDRPPDRGALQLR